MSEYSTSSHTAPFFLIFATASTTTDATVISNYHRIFPPVSLISTPVAFIDGFGLEEAQVVKVFNVCKRSALIIINLSLAKLRAARVLVKGHVFAQAWV
jgi:hypothetical protein